MQLRQIPINRQGMEITAHGAYAFPLAVYETQLDRCALGFVDWHWHEELQLVRAARGVVKFRVDERRFTLGAGQGLFIGSGRVHCAHPAQPGSAYLCLDFHPRILSGFAGSACESEYVTPFLRDPALEAVLLDGSQSWHARVLDRALSIEQQVRGREFGFELSVSAELMQIWRDLIVSRPPQSQPRSARGNARVRKMLDFIDAHSAEPLTLAQIAASASLSESEGSRTFRRVTGETAFSYLRGRRVARVMELLKSTSKDLEQIAAETGFGGASYLIRVFRERTGMTPRRFREQN